MDPMQIVLIILVIAGVWAVVELALVLRRTRVVVDNFDKTVDKVNNTIDEARPVVAKLDGVVDELQPAVAQVEPLLRQATVAVEALSADLVEVNGVLRDISAVSGAASSASNAVTGLADVASEKVHKLFARSHKTDVSAASRVLEDVPAESAGTPVPIADSAVVQEEPADEPQQYFTYSSSEESDHE